MENQIRTFRGTYFYILEDQELEEEETNADIIWVMSPDLHYETNSPGWRRTVFENVLRGARYVYFLEDTEQMRKTFAALYGRVSDFSATHGQPLHKGRVGSRFVPVVAPTEMILYDPDTPKERGFVVAPVGGARMNMRMDNGVRKRTRELFEHFL